MGPLLVFCFAFVAGAIGGFVIGRRRSRPKPDWFTRRIQAGRSIPFD